MRLMKLLAYKPLHFLLAGFVVWIALAPGTPRGARVEPLSLSPERIEALRQGWAASTGSPPGEQEMAYLVQRDLDDEILVREALARSLHRLDPVVRQRLQLNMRFLDPSSTAGDDELFEQALALDMHRNDLVVRRRLVQIMELSIEEGADRSPVSAAELAAMYEQRRDELEQPARWRLAQVYFSADRRKDRVQEDARRALAAIRAGDLDVKAAVALGDPFLGGHELPMLSAVQLAGQFGEAFAAAIAACPPAQWCGPIASSYGLHLVLVEQAQGARLPAASEPDVRRRLESDVMRARAKRALDEHMALLRQKYGVAS